MKNRLCSVCLLSPLFIAASMAHTKVSAQIVESYSANLNQWRDVSPTNGAYKALRSSVNRRLND